MKSIKNVISKKFSSLTYKDLNFTHKYLTLYNTPSEWSNEFVLSKFKNVGNLISVNEFSENSDNNNFKSKGTQNFTNAFRLNFNGLNEKNCVEILEKLMKNYNFNVEFSKSIANEFAYSSIIYIISKENKNLKEISNFVSFLNKVDINSYKIQFSMNNYQAFIQINNSFNFSDFKHSLEKEKVYFCEMNKEQKAINDTQINKVKADELEKNIVKNDRFLLNHLLLKKRENRYFINILKENSYNLYNNLVIAEKLSSKKKIFSIYNNSAFISN